MTKEELVRIAMGFVKPVERYNPDYIEEVQGIADGAGMKFEELMVLNSRTELAGQSVKERALAAVELVQQAADRRGVSLKLNKKPKKG